MEGRKGEQNTCIHWEYDNSVDDMSKFFGEIVEIQTQFRHNNQMIAYKMCIYVSNTLYES